MAKRLCPELPKGVPRRRKMLDALMLAAGVAFFMIAIVYVAACDHM
jgi:hypothetical protein